MDRRRIAEARRVFHRRARPLSLARPAKSMRCCAGSIRCRGGPLSRRGICLRASAARWRWRAIFMSGRNCCGPAGRRWCAVSSTAWRCIWQSRHGDVAYFRSAKLALRKLHRAGICHNDLAKEQNWLRGSDGRAYRHRLSARGLLQDARPAVPHRRLRGSAGISLKHKRSYAPEALTPKERKILARKSLVATHLACDRQEGLSRHHPRAVQFHRPRRRRPAAGQ